MTAIAPEKIKKLFAAIKAGDFEQVYQLLTSGVSANSKDAQKQHPLVLAASLGNVEIVKLLLQAGADIHAKSAIAPIPQLKPAVSTPSTPGSASLGAMMNEVLGEAPAEAKEFYAGFQQFVQTFSAPGSENLLVEAELATETEPGSEDTALIAAIAQNHLEVVKILLAAGAEVNPKVWYDTPPLQVAAHQGNPEIVRALIAAGADLHRGFDFFPLDEAASRGHIEVIKVLIAAGADVNQADEDGGTALMTAAYCGYLEVVKLLVAAGADVNAWGSGDTALLRAAAGGQKIVYDFLYPLVSEDIRQRGEKEIDKGIKRKEREQNQAVEKFIEAAMEGKVNLVKAAIAEGIDINAIGANGQTALMYAAHYAHLPVLQVLIDAGVDLDILSEEDDEPNGETALMQVAGSFFATGKRAQVIKMLADAGASVNLKNQQGYTALMYAAIAGYEDAIKALIAVGANLNARDNSGNTAMMLADAKKYRKIVRLLQELGADSKGMDAIALIKAAEQGNITEVQALIQAGANVNLRQETTALCQAVQNGNYEIAQILIAAGADVNLRANEGDLTPLLSAAYEGYLDLVQLLIQAGAEINLTVGDLDNVLEYAKLGMAEDGHQGRQHAEIIELLLKGS